ncbi:uncharacterized protein BcabD6B2_18330 [Babesia caballi]|uniref:Uncharacterized protein n=1 Tax=Babesia caballi TaxID=5871 RepID=A0AAV4LQE9_BABCB|nr:hypothetical protein BcabD6B2_18330 [Babesia caballi]
MGSLSRGWRLVIGAVLFEVGKLFGKGGTCDFGCNCGGTNSCNGGSNGCGGDGKGGKQCSNAGASCPCCKKVTAPFNFNSILTGSSLLCLFIAFMCLIALGIYLFQHVDYAPHLKSAFKSP